MFIDSIVYLYQSYWLIVLLVLLAGFVVGWKSCTSVS